MPSKPILVWFRQDLRLADNRALTAAVATDAPVLAAYVLDDVSPGTWKPGAASRWWLHHSLESLARDVSALGRTLVLRRGESGAALTELAKEIGAGAVYCARAYEPWAARLELSVRDRLDVAGIAFKRFAGTLLKEPEQIETGAGTPFKVYTPFWRAIVKSDVPATPLPAPAKLRSPAARVASDSLASWALLPKRPDWAGGLRTAWQPGEAGARRRLRAFLESGLKDYHVQRNRPDIAGTSRLSPHLHFGEVSLNQCWHAAASSAAARGKSDQGVETFLKELVWREFSSHLLHHWPDLPDAPFRREFAAFPWAKNDTLLRAWQRGQTGYPIVDAGMRELWATGWMHNRVRMIAASFLVKDLLIPWQKGEAWFWDTLVDADLASNAASWQWVAGSGADAAPYFRIFNPVTQGLKFDPEGAYVRRWVGEIARLPTEHIHAPWLAPEAVLAAAGVRLGTTYPRPVIDHAAARQRALAALERVTDARSE